MPLVLELGAIHDPATRRAFEQIILQIPGLVTTTGGGGGAPSGPAGGVLGGTYPNPGFAVDMATQAELDAHTTLTTTAHGGIVASTDPRLTDARTPTAHHTTHEPGGTDAMAVDAVAAAGSLRTLGTGAQQAAAGNDSRLSDARTPTAHATTHQPGGSDAMAVDAAAATGSLRTLGTTATSAAAGNRGLPVGGGSGQVLAKNTATDYDVGWTTPASGGGAATQTGAFSAYRAAALSLTSGGVVVFDTDSTAPGFDVSGWYDTTTGLYTPLVAGYYSFAAMVTAGAVLAADVNWEVQLQKNGVALHSGMVGFQRGATLAVASIGNWPAVSANGTTDTFRIIISHTVGATTAIVASSVRTWFQGAFASSVTGGVAESFVSKAKWFVD